MRTPIIAGNWKMNLTRSASKSLAQSVAQGVNAVENVEVVVAPTFVNLHEVHDALQGSSVHLAAQNMHFENSGAYTGEISPAMVKDIGCGYVLIGHSERRQHFFESDEMINQKLQAALSHSLKPILCVGESLAEREAGKTHSKVNFQIRAALTSLSAEQAQHVVIAYEPIWAIGTGKTATPEQAQDVHRAIRDLLRELYGEELAERMPLLYGGSVKPDNAESLLAQHDIDGALVGGASLKAENFLAIVQCAQRS